MPDEPMSPTRPEPPLGRLTRFKWLMGVLLLLALLIGWWTGSFGPSAGNETAPTDDAAPSKNAPVGGKSTSTPLVAVAPPATPTTGAAPAAGAAAVKQSPILTLERRGDGQIVVSGTVADSTTRDQWLNAIRIGAQGGKVSGAIAVAAVASAAPWSERLRQLTALTADRRLDSVRLEIDRVILRGPAVAGSYRRETEQLFRAQLPERVRVEFQASASPATTSKDLAQKEAARDAAKEASRDAAKEASKAAKEREAAKEAAKEASKEASKEAAKEGAKETATKEPSTETTREASKEGAKDVSREPLAKGAASPPGTGSVPPSAGSDSGAVKSTPPAVDAGQSSKAVRCPSRPDRLAANVYFRTDSVSVSEADRERLATLGKCLRNRRVSVIGHADRRQSEEYNLALSRRRAQAVADIIRSNAPPGLVVATTAVGASEAADTSRRETQQRSRRVEIRLR